MAWAKLDDRFYTNRKVRKAWRQSPAAIGLHVLAISYCADELLDGHVDEDFVVERIPDAKARRKITDALVAAGLWVVDGDGWLIVNYLEYNPSRAEVEQRREQAKAAAARGGKAKRTAKRTASEPLDDPVSETLSVTQGGSVNRLRTPVPVPEPIPVPPTRGERPSRPSSQPATITPRASEVEF